ncbi:MAG: hypothetical protein ACLQBX_17040 [Candidatus Limnocylindrales bacterium]
MPALEMLHRYLDLIGATDVLRERTEAMMGLYEAFLTIEPSSVFVSEYPREDGSRAYESLWLFTDKLAMEARIPTPGDEQFDFVPIAHGVRHLVVEAKDYDLRAASEASRMRVEMWLGDQLLGELKASGLNCDSLTAIVATYLVPNLAPPAAG